jgi:hypothetical protein
MLAAASRVGRRPGRPARREGLMDAKRRWFARAATGSIAALVLATGTIAPVAADTERGHRGVVGEHELVDSEVSPGAMCRDGDGAGSGERQIAWMRVRPPIARGVSGFGQQWIGWRVLLQRRRATGEWQTNSRSPEQLGITRSEGWVRFYPIALPVTDQTIWPFRYRVRVKIKWYPWPGPEAEPTGVAVHEVDWYRFVYKGEFAQHVDQPVPKWCPGLQYGPLQT